jgi:DNA polymerase elongation subunit (family B)
MMNYDSNFYTSVYLHKKEILLRGYEYGQKVQYRIPLQPYLFIETKKPTEYRTLEGKPVAKLPFGDVWEARKFVKDYEDVENFRYYGMTNYLYPFLNDYYIGKIKFDMSLLRIVNMDIEVQSDEGFPYPEFAAKPVTAVSLRMGERIVVLGCGEYKPKSADVTYHKCADEIELLTKFLDIWRSFDPDIVTGWNVEGFDMVYMINRIISVLGVEMARKLSPWEIIEKSTKFNKKTGQEYMIYEVFGVTTLDYMLLYQKFVLEPRESHKLDYIAQEELGEEKLDYSEYESLNELYKNDFTKFIDYNIHDTTLVQRLDDKLKLIFLCLSMAFDAKVTFTDTMGTVVMADAKVHNSLMRRNIVVPLKKDNQLTKEIEGGYVKEPKIVGMMPWVTSFDLTSLYPMLIIMYNISPETLLGKLDRSVSVDAILAGLFEDESIRAVMQDRDAAISAMGYLFSREKQGVFPMIMQELFDDRAGAKREMIECEKKVASGKYNGQELHDLEYRAKEMDIYQKAIKIQLNSMYGALANQYFRWYDVRLAESITVSGQLSIRWIANKLNDLFNRVMKTDGEDYVQAVDTDSVYLLMGDVVAKQFEGQNPTREEITDYVDDLCKSVIGPYINKQYNKLAVLVNAAKPTMEMKREIISDRAIWTAKKRYIMNMLDREGVRLPEPKLKIMGIEAVRSSTPAVCRTAIKKGLVILMSGTETELQTFVSAFRAEHSQLPFEDIALTTSANGLTEYSHPRNVYKKGCPYHVRASLVYNHLLKSSKLENKLNLIKQGEKVKLVYLKLPNPTRENVIATPGTLPRQLGLNKYIDYRVMFEKTFENGFGNIVEAVGWTLEAKSTFDGMWDDE